MAKQEKNQQAQTEHSQAGAVIEMLRERGYLGNQEINDAKLRDARQDCLLYTSDAADEL